jgi:hypothetical protein
MTPDTVKTYPEPFRSMFMFEKLITPEKVLTVFTVFQLKTVGRVSAPSVVIATVKLVVGTVVQTPPSSSTMLAATVGDKNGPILTLAGCDVMETETGMPL